MGYSLGIDLGATTCASAALRGTVVEPCLLGEAGAATMPAVAVPGPAGTTLTGEAADRRSPYEPTLVARMVSARLGDPEPIVVDGAQCDPLALAEALLRTAIDRAAPSPGVRPDDVVLAYPLRPGDAPERLLAEAARRVTGRDTTMVPEPVAAVARLAQDRDLGPDTIVAVVDFGGSSVDVTLVRQTPTAFDLIGDPGRLPDLGGVDLDATVLELVEGAIGDITSMVRPDDHAGMIALRRVRASCRDAKERLSTQRAAVVGVALPHARGRVEITRDAFERAVEGSLSAVADLVLDTIDAAGLIPADVRIALLTGGSARIPRFSQLVAARTGLAVVAEPAPELTVALGAALFAEVVDGEPDPDRGMAQLPPPAPAAASPPVDPRPEAWSPAEASTASEGPTRPGGWPADGSTRSGDWPADGSAASGEWPADEWTRSGDWPAQGSTNSGEWTADEWTAHDAWELEPAAEWQEPDSRWDDARTSVFDPAAPAGAGRAGSGSTDRVGADPRRRVPAAHDQRHRPVRHTGGIAVGTAPRPPHRVGPRRRRRQWLVRHSAPHRRPRRRGTRRGAGGVRPPLGHRRLRRSRHRGGRHGSLHQHLDDGHDLVDHDHRAADHRGADDHDRGTDDDDLVSPTPHHHDDPGAGPTATSATSAANDRTDDHRTADHLVDYDDVDDHVDDHGTDVHDRCQLSGMRFESAPALA